MGGPVLGFDWAIMRKRGMDDTMGVDDKRRHVCLEASLLTVHDALAV